MFMRYSPFNSRIIRLKLNWKKSQKKTLNFLPLMCYIKARVEIMLDHFGLYLKKFNLIRKHHPNYDCIYYKQILIYKFIEY